MIIQKNKNIMNHITKILGAGALATALIACTTNPMTGRKSFQFENNSELNALSLQQYKTTLSTAKVVTGTTAAKQVKTVGARIQNAAENYYRSIGRSQDLADYQWEFNLIDENQANAWCMPGGKVAVYTGILPITKNDNGLAVVLGHEVAHALAGHGNERISQARIAQYGGALLGASISNRNWAAIFNQLYPIGGQVVMKAYGRSQELEADQMGLYIMSMAGYDPREAQPFWQRMEAATSSSGNKTSAFLATHPNPATRRADIEKHLPKALDYYKIAGGKIK